MNRILLRTASIMLIAALAGPVLAQNLDNEVERPSYATDSQEETLRTAEEAREHKAVEGAGEVTYEMVMKDPDNIDLNYKYAKTQVSQGDIKGAAATLERILMVDPALPKVRLFFAVVLYRLDSLAHARKELLALKDLPMPESLRMEIEEYLDRIDKKMKRTTITGTLGLGYQYDVNRNAAPATGRRWGPAGYATLDGASTMKGDTSALFMGNIGVEHDLGTQAGHTLNGSMGYYRAEQTVVDTLDLQAYTFRFGGTIKHRYGNVKPRIMLDHIRLSEESYLRTRGLRIGWDKRVNNKIGLFADVGNWFDDYIETEDIPLATQRTGYHYDLKWGMNYVLNPTMRLTGSHGYEHKDARKRYYTYDRHILRGAHAWLLGKGRFLVSSLTMNRDRYCLPDISNDASNGKYRRDDTFRLNSTFGMPLGFIAKPLKDLLWTFTYEYFHSNSNFEDYGYTNNKVSTMFTYKWDHSF
ncbi:tetratricopeptide repeat protein [Elusimicrobiota bacterium]